MMVKEINQYAYLIEKIKQSGYKLTAQRRAVLDMVIYRGEKKHLSCEEIFQSVKCKYPKIGLSTVYRTIHLFEGLGLLNRIDLDDGCTRYELNNQEESSHCHLICLKCKEVSEVKEDLMFLLESLLYKRIHFAVKNRTVTFYGYCERCLKKQNEKLPLVT